MIMHILLFVAIIMVYYVMGGDRSLTNTIIRRKQVIWLGVVIFLFAALRSYSVGQDVRGYWPDYRGYYFDYILDANNSFVEIWATRIGRDPFFHIFCKLLSYISSSPQLMLITIGALVAYGFSYLVYHEKGNVLLFYSMFIGFRIYSFTLSGLRQAMAMSFIFLAYVFLKDRKMLRTFVFISLAAMFHRSALIFILAIPFFHVRNAYIMPLIAGGALTLNYASGNYIVASFADAFYGERFSGYLQRSMEMSFEGGATFYIYIAFYILILLSLRWMKRRNLGVNYEFNILTIAIMFSILGQQMSNVFRIAYYFIFVLFALFGQWLDVAIPRKDSRTLVTFVIILALAMQYLVLGPGAGTEDYQFFWDEPYIYG